MIWYLYLCCLGWLSCFRLAVCVDLALITGGLVFGCVGLGCVVVLFGVVVCGLFGLLFLLLFGVWG